jgi:hypothetical protein
MKIDFEKAKNIIESNSMKLIWTKEEFDVNYKTTTDTKIPVVCSCERKKELKLANIRNGSTCRECADERNRNLQKKNRTTFCMAVDICKENGFKLTWSEEEYNENFETMTKPIPVKCCNCEKESNRTLTNVKTGTRCKHCVVPATRLLQYDEVKDVYTQNGMKLLWNEKDFSEKFTGCDQKLPVICICNEKKELCYTNVRQGHKCQDCGNNRKKNYDEVFKIVEDNGLNLNMSAEKFNDVYKGMNSPITILCKCEKEYTVRINDVKFGYSCKDCGFEKFKNTNIERFGFPYAIQNEEIKEKIRNTNMERYGVANPFLSEEIKDKIRNTNMERYGVANPFLSEETKDKIRNTNMERYGVEYPFLCEEIKDKIRNTNMERYGVTNLFLSEEIKEKIKYTNMERYGVEYPFLSEEIKEKIKYTNMERYGVEYPSQNKDIMKKMQDTCLERHGVRHPLQNEEIFKKAVSKMKSFKTFTFPSGNIIEMQGYEHFALKELLDNGIIEEDIITGSDNVPEIWYIDGENKKRRHYVDIYIKSQNRCIEVKSEWTLKLQEKFMSYKQNTAKNIGYEYEIWIYDHKGVKLREEK